MSNPLYHSVSQNQQMGGINNFIQRLNQLKRSFSGDPQQQIQQLLNSGKVTQDQYNRAVQQAQAIQKMLHG